MIQLRRAVILEALYEMTRRKRERRASWFFSLPQNDDVGLLLFIGMRSMERQVFFLFEVNY